MALTDLKVITYLYSRTPSYLRFIVDRFIFDKIFDMVKQQYKAVTVLHIADEVEDHLWNNPGDRHNKVSKEDSSVQALTPQFSGTPYVTVITSSSAAEIASLQTSKTSSALQEALVARVAKSTVSHLQEEMRQNVVNQPQKVAESEQSS